MTARALTAFALTLLLAAPAFAQEEAPPPPAAPAPEAPPPAVAPAAAPAAVAAADAKRFAKPGVLEVGGGLSLAFDTADVEGTTYKTFNMGLSPYLLYFIIKGLSVGGTFEVNYFKSWSGDTSSDGYTIAIMPKVEYNFDLGGRLFPYAGAALGYGYAKSGDVKINQFRFVPEGGVKMTFGGGPGGVLGLGIQIPVILHDPDVAGSSTYTQAGFAIITRYAVWF